MTDMNKKVAELLNTWLEVTPQSGDPFTEEEAQKFLEVVENMGWKIEPAPARKTADINSDFIENVAVMVDLYEEAKKTLNKATSIGNGSIALPHRGTRWTLSDVSIVVNTLRNAGWTIQPPAEPEPRWYVEDPDGDTHSTVRDQSDRAWYVRFYTYDHAERARAYCDWLNSQEQEPVKCDGWNGECNLNAGHERTGVAGGHYTILPHCGHQTPECVRWGRHHHDDCRNADWNKIQKD